MGRRRRSCLRLRLQPWLPQLALCCHFLEHRFAVACRCWPACWRATSSPLPASAWLPARACRWWLHLLCRVPRPRHRRCCSLAAHSRPPPQVLAFELVPTPLRPPWPASPPPEQPGACWVAVWTRGPAPCADEASGVIAKFSVADGWVQRLQGLLVCWCSEVAWGEVAGTGLSKEKPEEGVCLSAGHVVSLHLGLFQVVPATAIGVSRQPEAVVARWRRVVAYYSTKVGACVNGL